VYLLRCQRVRECANRERSLKSSDAVHGIAAPSGVNFRRGWPFYYQV